MTKSTVRSASLEILARLKEVANVTPVVPEITGELQGSMELHELPRRYLSQLLSIHPDNGVCCDRAVETACINNVSVAYSTSVEYFTDGAEVIHHNKDVPDTLKFIVSIVEL